MKIKFFFIFWLAALALLAVKYPPGLHWREINRGHFLVIFPGERWQQAEAVLSSAEKTYAKLAAFWRDQPAGRIRIVLDDSSDESNGFATFFPFHLVGINLHEPAPDSTLSCSRAWLDLVLAHELTHIFTMNAAAEPFRILRRVYGSLPLLYPAIQLPPWVIEGLAVWGESKLTGDGRLNHPPYHLMLAVARQDNLFPDWSPISGLPSAWPGPSAKYLFGGGFIEFLAAKYGTESLRQYLEQSTGRLVIFSSSRDFENTFGKPLATLWDEYRNNPPTTKRPQARKPVHEPLMQKGFLNQYPCCLDEKRLAVYHRDYRGRGTIDVLDMKSGRMESLFKMDGVNGLSFAAEVNSIFLSATEYFHSFSQYSDLYQFDIKKRHGQRLSYGQRLSQPVKKVAADEIYCVQRRMGRFFLALFNTRTRKVKTLSHAFTGIAQLSLSPDQSLIAASVKKEDQPWGIGVFSTSGELLALLTAAGADCRQPAWQSNHKLYFIRADAHHTQLASASPLGNDGFVCSDPRLAGLQQFSLDPDSEYIYFTYFSGRGLEIAQVDLAGLLFSPGEFSADAGLAETAAVAPKVASRPYRFWRDVLPRYWATSARMGGDEFQAGILTGGQDALGIHSFSLEGYYGFSSHRANVLCRYTYDGLLPTLTFSYYDSSDFYRDGDTGASRRSQELKLESHWPLRIRKRSQWVAYADMHRERRTVIHDSGLHEDYGSYTGFRLGIAFNSSREYYDSISPADGMSGSLQYSMQPAGLGNEFASRSLQADWRHYISVFRPGVLAWRLAMAKSWNAGENFYSLGGREGEGGSSLGHNHPFDLLRGLPAYSQQGDSGFLFNLEYRLPLFKIEKAILPAVSLDRVYLNVFFDMGRLWQGNHPWPSVYSVGGEAMLRLAFGGSTAFDLAFGAAYGFGPERGLYFYTRLGRSF